MPLDRSRVVLFHPNKPPELFDLRRGASLGSLPVLGPSTNICGFGTQLALPLGRHKPDPGG